MSSRSAADPSWGVDRSAAASSSSCLRGRVGAALRRDRERGREAKEGTGTEKPGPDRTSSVFHAVSVETKIDGSFVTTASTPASSTRSRSSRSSTVQATTGAPSACARATASRLTRSWWRTRALRSRAREQRLDQVRGERAPSVQDRGDDESQTASAMDAQAVPRERHADPQAGMRAREPPRGRVVERAQEAPLDEPEPRELVGDGTAAAAATFRSTCTPVDAPPRRRSPALRPASAAPGRPRGSRRGTCA